MDQKNKQKIVDLLRVFVENKGSQNKAANSLKGVSIAVVSHLLNGKWEPYSDDMFRNIGNQLGFNSLTEQFTETANAKRLLKMLNKAKVQRSVMTVLSSAGAGKSMSSKKFASENPEAIRVECAVYWDEKYFLQEILLKMGVKNPHNRVPDMMNEIVTRLKNYDTPPILLIDEVDKLGDRLLYFLITFYNELKWSCGIILFSTYYFKKRLQDGLRNRKKGYEELWSRYGTFYELEQTTAMDVLNYCETQGMSDKTAIKRIQKSSNGDLRIAAEMVRIWKMENAA